MGIYIESSGTLVSYQHHLGNAMLRSKRSSLIQIHLGSCMGCIGSIQILSMVPKMEAVSVDKDVRSKMPHVSTSRKTLR